MCIIVYKPAGEELTKAVLKECWRNNPDGGGIMFTDGKKIHVLKTMGFRDYWKKYRTHVHEKGIDAVLHFRIGTSGTRNIFNVHPFSVSRNMAFCHNGILTSVNIPNKSKKNDTQIFNDVILKGLPKGFLRNASLMALIEEYIGTDKLVFMELNGTVTIVNEYYGKWDKGVWYSNDSYEVSRYSYLNNHGTYPASGHGGVGGADGRSEQDMLWIENQGPFPKDGERITNENTVSKGAEVCEQCGISTKVLYYQLGAEVCEHCYRNKRYENISSVQED